MGIAGGREGSEYGAVALGVGGGGPEIGAEYSEGGGAGLSGGSGGAGADEDITGGVGGIGWPGGAVG